MILLNYLAERSVHTSEEQVSSTLREAFEELYIQKSRDPEALCSPEAERRFWMELYRYVLGRLGVHNQLTQDEIHQCCHELFDLYMEPEHYTVFDDVLPTLQRLQEAGIKIGLISNFASELRLILEAKGLLSYFDPLIISADAGVEKPNPAIFRMALEQSGLEAADVLYIGDHETNDIWAPAQVGMDAVRILRYPYQKGDGIHSLQQLFDK
jgi:putative hydrolase of the HAD superfamily